MKTTTKSRKPRRCDTRGCNEVYRDVGSQQHAPDDPDFIELLSLPFDPDSALLLCSDGLSDQVTAAEIMQTVIANAGHPGGAVHELIEAANRAGGKDNVTVLIVEGESFAAARSAPVTMAAPAGPWFTSRPAVFVYGFILAALIAAGLRQSGVLDRPPAVPPPQTLLVGTGAGSFTSIAEALAKARPGDTVEVASGEYAEPLRLKSGVTLRGRTPDVPVLQGRPPSDPGRLSPSWRRTSTARAFSDLQFAPMKKLRWPWAWSSRIQTWNCRTRRLRARPRGSKSAPGRLRYCEPIPFMTAATPAFASRVSPSLGCYRTLSCATAAARAPTRRRRGLGS